MYHTIFGLKTFMKRILLKIVKSASAFHTSNLSSPYDMYVHVGTLYTYTCTCICRLKDDCQSRLKLMTYCFVEVRRELDSIKSGRCHYQLQIRSSLYSLTEGGREGREGVGESRDVYSVHACMCWSIYMYSTCTCTCKISSVS